MREIWRLLKRVLLDECVPKRLAGDITGHEATSLHDMGWGGTKNGNLLQLAATQFDCFLTVDKNLQFQQNVPKLPIAVLQIIAVDNKRSTLQKMMPQILQALAEMKICEYRKVGA